MTSLTAEVSNYIRKELRSFPDVRPLENKYPIVENDKVFIMNEMHQSKKLRKMHLEIGYTDNIEVMHCVLYPSVDYPIPIFGADIVATPKVITAAIIDITPVFGTERLIELYKDISLKYEFEENRILPQWGEEIFSEGCKFVRIKTEKEKQMYLDMIKDSLYLYRGIVENAVFDMQWINTMKRIDDQCWYCTSQRKNTKTKAVLSQWFDPKWADEYINDVLFDKPKWQTLSNT